MPNVVRFALPTARSLYVSGVGQFVAGIFDVDANDLEAVGRARYRLKPYGAVEVGTVDAATPKPSLPAVPGPPNPDPYPQYPTMDEIVASSELRAAFVAAVDEGGEAIPGMAGRIVFNSDGDPLNIELVEVA